MRTRRSFFLTASALALAALWACAPAAAAVVLATSTGDPTLDQKVQATLQAYGHTVDTGPPFTQFDNSVDLSGYDAVLLLVNVNWQTDDMPASGQQALLNFVSAGGGLVTGEWTVWLTHDNFEFTILADALPVVPTTTFSSGLRMSYKVQTPDAILNAGLPSKFGFAADNISGTETFFQPRVGATVFYISRGSANGDGVIGWDYGNGSVLSFSTIIGTKELSNADYSRLVSNAIDWVTRP
jgi:hypothetical protein